MQCIGYGTIILSESLMIPPRFTSKILRKLMLEGVVRSIRGVKGGNVTQNQSKESVYDLDAITGEILRRESERND